MRIGLNEKDVKTCTKINKIEAHTNYKRAKNNFRTDYSTKYYCCIVFIKPTLISVEQITRGLPTKYDVFLNYLYFKKFKYIDRHSSLIFG